MIEVSKLKESDKGRKVIYNPYPSASFSDPDLGVIDTWNKEFIFVKYEQVGTAKATNPEDLTFLEPKVISIESKSRKEIYNQILNRTIK